MCSCPCWVRTEAVAVAEDGPDCRGARERLVLAVIDGVLRRVGLVTFGATTVGTETAGRIGEELGELTTVTSQ